MRTRSMIPLLGACALALACGQVGAQSKVDPGKREYDANCASCHGRFGTGSDKGPPLMHDIYNPGHHADEAFQRAVRNGVPQHHWRFGDMPPQPQVGDEQLAQIVRYVRELQQANGILFAPHRM